MQHLCHQTKGNVTLQQFILSHYSKSIAFFLILRVCYAFLLSYKFVKSERSTSTHYICHKHLMLILVNYTQSHKIPRVESSSPGRCQCEDLQRCHKWSAAKFNYNQYQNQPNKQLLMFPEWQLQRATLSLTGGSTRPNSVSYWKHDRNVNVWGLNGSRMNVYFLKQLSNSNAAVQHRKGTSNSI